VGGSIVSCTIGLTATINISFKMSKLLQNVMDLFKYTVGHKTTRCKLCAPLTHANFTIMLITFNTSQFHSTSMNVLSSMPIKGYSLPYAVFQENQKLSTALYAELLHLTSPKPVNICTKSTALTQPIVGKLTVT
jgi:hypothetical protein